MNNERDDNHTKNSIFKKFGPAFLAIALGIGSGEFILWPFMTAHYGFGILWGALLGISIQFFLIIIIQKYTLIFRENIVQIFTKVFSYSVLWIVISTILGFGWPAFATIMSLLITEGLGVSEKMFLPISLFLILFSGSLLIFSKNAYRRILAIQKVNIVFLLFLSLFLFFYYFDFQIFSQMLVGFFGYSSNYFFIPAGLSLATFLAAIAYAGSGGNLLLANSFYARQEDKNLTELSPEKFKKKYQNIFLQNFVFFFCGGLLIITLLSYVSYVTLQGSLAQASNSDFSFLIAEAQMFSQQISPIIGKLFLFSGIFALFGVQLGIFDFIGRISGKYKLAVFAVTTFGVLVLLSGFQQPKSLLITGAVINAFSMGIIALLLFLVEKNKISKIHKSKKVLFGLIFASVFYFLFFTYVIYETFLI